MNITLGQYQQHTSSRMLAYPFIGKVVAKVFGYTNIGNYARFTVFRKLMDKVPLKAESKILDLGCGYGEYSLGLAKSMPEAQVHALDIDSERVETLAMATLKSGVNNIKLYNRAIENLDEENYDLVFSIDVFEHIAPQEMPFEQCYNKLNTGGYLIVKIPNVQQKTILPESFFEDHHHWLEEEHIGQVYDLNQLKKRFLDSGFKVVASFYSDGWLSRLAWELAYVGKKIGTISHLVMIPVSKLLIKLDRLVHRGKWGNAIQVIGQKI